MEFHLLSVFLFLVCGVARVGLGLVVVGSPVVVVVVKGTIVALTLTSAEIQISALRYNFLHRSNISLNILGIIMDALARERQSIDLHNNGNEN